MALVEEAAPVEEEVKKEIKEQEIEKPEEVGETIETKAESLTSKDPDTATMEDVKSALEMASEAQKAGLNEVAEDVLKWAKDALNALVEKALSKCPCSAEIEDVRQAIELAAEALKIPGMEATADQLMDWARAAFQSYAARRVAAGADAQERTELAVEAQKIPGPDMDQLAEDLMAGKAITPAYPPTAYTYSVHAEYTEPIISSDGYLLRTDYFVVDAYTCKQDVHFGWNGKILWKTVGFDGSTSTDELAVSFDADGVVIWPWEEGSVEIGAKIIDENMIVFTLVLRAPGVPDWVMVFPPAEIVRGAPELH